MVAATADNWLLELAQRADGWTAWVSDPDRYVVGFGRGDRARDAVRAALADAGTHYRKAADAITGLERAYFGPCGRV